MTTLPTFIPKAPPTSEDPRIAFRLLGPHGLAYLLPPVTNPDALLQTSASVAQWVVHLPTAHPVWPHYLVAVSHLRPIPGTPDISAELHYPDASHEFIISALSPIYAPWDEATAIGVICQGTRIRHPRYEPFALTPPHVGVHLRAVADPEAQVLAALAVDAMLHGKLSPEPTVREEDDHHARWVDVLHAGVTDGRLAGL